MYYVNCYMIDQILKAKQARIQVKLTYISVIYKKNLKIQNGVPTFCEADIPLSTFLAGPTLRFSLTYSSLMMPQRENIIESPGTLLVITATYNNQIDNRQGNGRYMSSPVQVWTRLLCISS